MFLFSGLDSDFRQNDGRLGRNNASLGQNDERRLTKKRQQHEAYWRLTHVEPFYMITLNVALGSFPFGDKNRTCFYPL